MEKQTRNVLGIIHIGTVNMTMKIISYSSLDDMEIIENVAQEVKYGEMVFQSRHVSFQSLNEICQVLLGFRQLLRDYDVKDVRVLSTTAISEADNLINVLDQIRIRTGFHVEVTHMTKEIFYKFFGLYYNVLKGKFNFADKAVMLLDITSGGVGLTGWKNDCLLFQQNINIGSLRILENFTEKQRNELTFPTAVREYIYGTLYPLWKGVQQYGIKYIVLSGRGGNLIARLMGKASEDGLFLITAQELRQFIYSLKGVTPFKIMKRFGLSQNLANVVMPTILLYYELLRLVDIDMLVVMPTTFTEGYTMYYVAKKTKHPYLEHLQDLRLDMMRRMAYKYLSDSVHSTRIEEYCNVLFEALYKFIGLRYETKYLLQMAAIFHETGKFINIRKHNLCTYNLIGGTDLFGVADDEKEILAAVLYYAFDGTLQDASPVYGKLLPRQKVITSKLTAIFRLADSLDKSHLGKITDLRAELGEDELIVYYTADSDISLERWTYMKMAVYFSEVFGISTKLVKG